MNLITAGIRAAVGELRAACILAVAIALAAPVGPALAAGPEPGTPEYFQRDNQNMQDAYGRQFAPGGQVGNPAYSAAQIQEQGQIWWEQIGQQVATPGHLAITPGNVFPGWNGGNPFRHQWSGSRGVTEKVSWTNRYGALIRGTVYAPLPGAKDPYTGRKLEPPYPGAVITTGSIQGSEGMYVWLAQDLAERGYVVLTYDVQGQGTSETLPHEGDQVNALPFCNPFAEPRDEEMFGCPGVPAQQSANFVFGTQDALSFFLSTPGRPYPNPHSADTAGDDTPVREYNPYWNLFDRSKDTRSVTPGRRTRVAIIGHSLGASAVSKVQGIDPRVEVVVALDKLSSGGDGPTSPGDVKPVVPALAVQSEYGFNVQPYWASHGSSFAPQPDDPSKAPDPPRELKTGFEAWRKAGVDSMLIVPRASTHLEYTDIAYVMPASRYGQALTSVYVQEWLDRYLKHHGDPAIRIKVKKGKKRRVKKVTFPPSALLAKSFDYLEPVDVGKWKPVKLERDPLLSFYFCSGYAMREPGSAGRRTETRDITGVGCK